MIKIANPDELTPQEKRILDAFSDYRRRKGYAPSQRELAKIVGLKSPNTVDYHLKKLEAKGYVEPSRNRSRAVELIKQTYEGVMEVVKTAQASRVPLLGTVAAGYPALAVEDPDADYIEVDPSLVRGKSFALKVRGDSMKDAGIFEGDAVIVRVQQTAQDGDIVVARIDDEATVKHFRRRPDGNYLMPANPKYSPIPANEAVILGRVTGVIRKY
jgi:repressor LexA